METRLIAIARYLLGVATFAAVFALVAWLGYQLVPGIAKVTPIWFPAAIGLAVLLVHKLRYWPGAFLGPLLFSYIIDVPMDVALASCLGNLVAAVLGAVWLRRAGFDLRMSRFQDGVRFIAYGAVIPSAIGAVIGCASLYFGGLAAREDLLTVFLFWFLSDTDGVLVLAPLLFAVAGYVRTSDYLGRWKELAALGLATLLIATVVYGYYGLNPGNPLPTYIMFPLAMWAVLRFDAVIVGFVLLAAVAFGISGTLFAAGGSETVLHGQILELQTFVAVLAASCILIGAFRRQEAAARTRADELARLQQEEMEDLVDARTLELQAANAELSAFNRAVSHDLRTPLNGFVGLLELLEDDLRQSAAGRQVMWDKTSNYLEGLRLSAESMQAMITALLNLSLSQHRELTLAPVDFSKLCEEVREAIVANPAGGHAGAVVRIQPGMQVQADPVLMRVLVQNLLDNALKYSASATQPTIQVYPRDDAEGRRWIVFEDNGIGFGEEGPARLFEPFHRLSNASHLRGSGIGLATVRHIVERHHGHVRAERCAAGGACFALWLPEAREKTA